MPAIVLSGIRATGRLQLGNFLGAVQKFVEFQAKGETCLYFIADIHSLTTFRSADDIRCNLLGMAKDYIAAGLDPAKSILFVQSSVPETVELAMYLAMFQQHGDLLTIPTFKEKVRKGENVSLGLVTYPVLMAADILGPQATLVPVGVDQVPNVELARDLARRFNNRFGEVFTMPEMMEEMVKVPGLDGEKMGKSDSNNAIDINDPIDRIRKLYREKGITDESRKQRKDPGDPFNRCKSVYPVHELVTAGEVATRSIARKCMNAEIGCVECKDLLVDNIAKLLSPFQEKRKELENQDDQVKEILHEGGKKARALIVPTVQAVREKLGIQIF